MRTTQRFPAREGSPTTSVSSTPLGLMENGSQEIRTSSDPEDRKTAVHMTLLQALPCPQLDTPQQPVARRPHSIPKRFPARNRRFSHPSRHFLSFTSPTLTWYGMWTSSNLNR